MKVMGGIAPGDTLENLAAGPYPSAIGTENASLAIRYSLGVEGVAAVNIGVYNAREVEANAEIVRNYVPLSADEHKLLEKKRKALAAKWGEHFGPVVEKA